MENNVEGINFFASEQHPMKLSDIAGSRNMIKKIAQHEFGHYISSRVYGFKTDGVEITLLDYVGGHIGGAAIELDKPIDTMDEVKEYLESRIIILFAGVLAENMTKGKVNEKAAVKSLEITGENDFSKIRELLKLLANILCQSDDHLKSVLDKVNDRLWEKAVKLVEQESDLIEGLAEKFVSEIEQIHTKYNLTERDLAEIPNLKKRFSN